MASVHTIPMRTFSFFAGIPAVDPAKREGYSFHMINKVLQQSSGYGRLFLLINDCDASDSAVDVFRKKEGVYLIHSYYFHKEDVDFPHAEPVHHYIVYNAGTRVLFLYPEVRNGQIVHASAQKARFFLTF